MTQEYKDLLLKDLCARLPYGVKCSHKNKDIYSLTCIDLEYNYIFIKHIGGLKIGEPDIKTIKPYLFPLSSMTEEQKENALPLLNNCDYYIIDGTIKWLDNCPIAFFDWCNKHHFDYRGLIPKGLANDATGLNIY